MAESSNRTPPADTINAQAEAEITRALTEGRNRRIVVVRSHSGRNPGRARKQEVLTITAGIVFGTQRGTTTQYAVAAAQDLWELVARRLKEEKEEREAADGS
jgi:hypothetical protein